MSLLNRLFGTLPRKVNDPVLGTLTRADDHWSGQATWAHGEVPFALTVYRAAEVPQPADAQLFQQLAHDYPLMGADLAQGLIGPWNEHRQQAGGGPVFTTPQALWTQVQLQGLGLHADGHADLIFGFASEDQPEGAFIATVRGRFVESVEYVA